MTASDRGAAATTASGKGTDSVAPAGGDRVLTIPNVISLVRLSCLPVFLWLLFSRENRAAAAWLLAGLGATDWVDGYIARHFDQVSDLGKILDPVADRLLFFVGVGGILVDGSVPRWFAWAVLIREGVVGTTTVVIALLGARRIDVTWFGKAGTFGLMVAFPLFLDPGWDVEVPIVPGLGAGATDAAARWDGQAVTAWDGTYGSYVLDKVAKVFPELAA